MFIVHTESATLGGEAYRLIEEIRYINEKTEHRSIIIGPSSSDFEEVARRENIPFIGFNFRGFDYHPFNFLDALRLLGNLKPHIVHTHHSADAWIFGVSARLLNIPIVRGRHISLPFKKSFFKNLVYTHLADAFTVSCSSIKDMMIKARLATPEEIFITPAGVNLKRFNLENVDKGFLRRELNLQYERFLIGTACFLRSWKGVDTLMDAFSILMESSEAKRTVTSPPFELIIAGKGTEKMKETEIYKRYRDRIHILGHREDIERVIGSLDLFILTSKKSEGVPQVILQAMALKVPCIGSDIGGIPDVIKDGLTGWLVKPNDPQVLAEKILYVYNLSSQERESVVERAFSMVHDGYTVKRTVENYFRAYEYAMRKRGIIIQV